MKREISTSCSLQLTDALSETQYEYEIVVVDDGSTDGTVEQVRDWAERDPRIRLLSRAGERGLAGAVLYGWSQSRANLLGVIDADLQHPPELLPELLKAAEQADIAIASRYAQNHGTKGWNPLRAAVSRLSTLAAAPLIQQEKSSRHRPHVGFFHHPPPLHRRADLPDHAASNSCLKSWSAGASRRRKEVPYHFGLRHARQKQGQCDRRPSLFASSGPTLARSGVAFQ